MEELYCVLEKFIQCLNNLMRLLIAALILICGCSRPAQVAFNEIDTPIRVLILKHSNERMASDDAKLVLEAIAKAAKEDLDISAVGDHFIHETKKIRVFLCGYDEKIENLKEFISEQMRLSATKDSTFIVFTVGHGSPSGNLHNLGERSELQKAIAEAAEENDQKVLWWQLSCYSAADLPPIESLSLKQRKLLSVLNTSDEKSESAAYIEGGIMEKMFESMISEDMDLDGNQEIDGYEFKIKMNEIKKGRGDLFRTNDMSAPLFGVSEANKIVIVDVAKGEIVPRGFIPHPSKEFQVARRNRR